MIRITFARFAVSVLAVGALVVTSAATSAVQQRSKTTASRAHATPAGHLVAFGGGSASQRVAGSKLDAALSDLQRRANHVGTTNPLLDLRSINPAAHFMASRSTGVTYVAVDAVTRGDAQRLKAQLVGLGMQRPAVYLNDVGGWLPISALSRVSGLTELHSIRASMSRTRAGVALTQGDLAQGSAALRTANSVNGSGVTVGIMSDSYNCYATYAADGTVPATGNNGYANNGFNVTAAQDIASGDLPSAGAINILQEGDCLNFDNWQLPYSDEGRAMMQVVHDVAPGAALAFYSAASTEADFATGIQSLATAGAKVIADDVGYFDEPFFQDGLIAQAINQVNAGGVAYFSAAGNSGSNGYDNLAPKFTIASTNPANEQLLNFDASGNSNIQALEVTIPQLVPGEFIAIILEWDQPYVTGASGSPGASSQLDLCMIGGGGGLAYPTSDSTTSDLNDSTVVCTGPNATGVDPVQILLVGFPANASTGVACPSGTTGATICSAATTLSFQVGLTGGSAPGRIKLAIDDNGAGVSYPGSIVPRGGTLQGHPGAAGAMAVAAVFWGDTPACGTTPAQLETYSALGGDPILFDKTGTAQTALVRQKPDIAGPDGGDNTFLGFLIGTGNFGSCSVSGSFPGFFGTSAATPHVAAAAALLLQQTPALTPAAVYSALAASSIPVIDYPGSSQFLPGSSYGGGYGFVQVNHATVDPGIKFATSISPASIQPGASSTYTWSVTNATSGCTGSGSLSGTQPSSGSMPVTPGAAGTYYYTLTCSNSVGQAFNTQVLTVTAPLTPQAPTINASLNPTTINAGGSSTYTWNVINATSCTASGAWSGTQAFSGTLPITQSTAGSYDYTLTCTNDGSETVDTEVLTVLSSGGGGGGGGGGGALDLLALLALGAAAGTRLARRRSAR